MDNEKKLPIFNSQDSIVRKSNAFITAKYKSSLLENQLVSISLTRIKIVGKEPQATIYPSELQELFGKKDTNIYKKLKAAANNMIGHSIVIEDGIGNFKAFSMIPNAQYIDGCFTVFFNKELAPYITNLSGRYTSYHLANILHFKHDYTFRIYEILKKEDYLFTKGEKTIVKDYSLNEFKCMIGVVNMDEAGVKRARNRGASWDEIVEKIAVEKKFSDWTSFKRRVLDPAKLEMAEKCDIRFEYDTKRYGKGGKVSKLRFYIMQNDPNSKAKEEIGRKSAIIQSSEYVQREMAYELPESLEVYVGHNRLTTDNIASFYESAGYDAEMVVFAIEEADKQSHIRNYVGWIINCIQSQKSGKYQEPISVISGDANKADKVNELMKSMESDRQDPNSEIKLRVWAKTKQKADYVEFLKYLSVNGLDESTIETIYSVQECIDLYIKWHKGESDIF